MWNQQLRYKIGSGYATTSASNSWVVDSNGQVTKVAEQATFEETPYYQVTQADRDPQMYARVYSRNDFPARRSGEVIVLNDYLDPAVKPRSEEHTSELQSRENLVCRLL